MARLPYHPHPRDMKTLRAQWDRDDAERDADDVPLKDFDTTLTSGIDDTVRHLKALGHHARPSVEQQAWQTKAFDELRDEVKKLREAHAALVQTVNTKASKHAHVKFSGELTTKIDKRVDNIFKLIGALGVILGILIALKGH